ncbi:MAG: L-threonylcarbamoyladenylate synthase [Oscillospiraceae bacterium]|nr:L-threonylcarbamoyladenylate synthase [Oscillospiraceae bacterium]
MSKVYTIIAEPDNATINKAVELLKAGESVALPTETVYGLAGNALEPSAIAKIFAVKNRPQDNPLIVHVSDVEMARGLGLEVHSQAEKLAEMFWPGPLTMVLKKVNDTIPPQISCGLDTVAVRVPADETFLKIIKKGSQNNSQLPLAAPSANASGSPSPTAAAHVYSDLNGKIPLIIDGGECKIGIESTVIAFDNTKIRILRPGAVTPEMLSEFAETLIDDAVYEKVAGTAQSPGVKHRHYSPKATVTAVIADSEQAFLDYSLNHAHGRNFAVASPDAQTLFAKFRQLDELGANQIFIRLPEPAGLGLALYNRIVRAAEFNVIDLRIIDLHGN